MCCESHFGYTVSEHIHMYIVQYILTRNSSTLSYMYMYIVYPLHVHTCICNPNYTITITCTRALFRPMINKKLEEKVCGDGPCLSIVFEDDIELMDLHQEIQVGLVI